MGHHAIPHHATPHHAIPRHTTTPQYHASTPRHTTPLANAKALKGEGRRSTDSLNLMPVLSSCTSMMVECMHKGLSAGIAAVSRLRWPLLQQQMLEPLRHRL